MAKDLVRRLLYEFESQAPPRENIRAVRALEVLERIGTDEARKLLEELAKGARKHRSRSRPRRHWSGRRRAKAT